MVHTICSSIRSEDIPYLRRTWSTLFAPDLDLASKLERLFDVETDQFGVDHAFFTRIDRDGGIQHFETVYAPEGGIEAGQTVPLSKSYCRKTIEHPDGTMVIDDATAEGFSGDPAYETFGLGSYIGTTVTTEDELYGTLCFANEDPRGEPFVEQETALLEMYGQWVSYELNQWTAGPPDENTVEADSGGLVSMEIVDDEVLGPSRTDAMMEVLGKRPRRVVLFDLMGDAPTVDFGSHEGTTDTERDRIEMNHVHLPKLEAAGYVEWDRDTNEVTRGPRFYEIEPVLRVLENYTGEYRNAGR